MQNLRGVHWLVFVVLGLVIAEVSYTIYTSFEEGKWVFAMLTIKKPAQALLLLNILVSIVGVTLMANQLRSRNVNAFSTFLASVVLGAIFMGAVLIGSVLLVDALPDTKLRTGTISASLDLENAIQYIVGPSFIIYLLLMSVSATVLGIFTAKPISSGKAGTGMFSRMINRFATRAQRDHDDTAMKFGSV